MPFYFSLSLFSTSLFLSPALILILSFSLLLSLFLSVPLYLSLSLSKPESQTYYSLSKSSFPEFLRSSHNSCLPHFIMTDSYSLTDNSWSDSRFQRISPRTPQLFNSPPPILILILPNHRPPLPKIDRV